MSLLARVREEETLPRQNGELVFEEPWEARAFSVAVALAENGRYQWDEFRSRLADEIGQRDEADDWHYYVLWVNALERLLIAEGVTDAEELGRRVDEVAHAIAHEHEHDHHHPEGESHA